MFSRLWIWKINFAFYYGVWPKLCERSRDVWKWLNVCWPSWLMSPLFFTILIEILKKKTYDASFPHLQPVVKLRRNQRGEIGRQHVKAHSCSHFSPCFDHTSPNQTDDGISQIDHDIGAYVPYSFRTMHGFFHVPFQLEYKDEGDKANGLTPPPNDTIIWTEKGVLVTASMISPGL